MKALAWFLRIAVGCLFVFSGFIKANDPVGFEIKMDEYFSVFSQGYSCDRPGSVPTDPAAEPSSFWLFFKGFALEIAMLMVIVEMILGLMLLIGYRVKLTLILLMLMTVFFTFLTFYSAYCNKVTDCGCFGDFLHLKPWQSFYKDVVLIAMITPLFFLQKHIKPLLRGKLMLIAMAAGTIASVAFPVYTLNFLPVFDFRAYKVGTNLLEAMSIPPGAPTGKYETYFLYTNLNTGKQQQFTLKDYPWQDTLTWRRDSMWTVTVEEPYQPPIHDFHLNNLDGFEYTEEILGAPGLKFFIVAYDLSATSIRGIRKLEDFTSLCQKENIPVYLLTSSPDPETFVKENDLKVEILFVDGTQLKTMIRSNPGLVRLNGPEVTGMWHYNSFPTFNEAKANSN